MERSARILSMALATYMALLMTGIAAQDTSSAAPAEVPPSVEIPSSSPSSAQPGVPSVCPVNILGQWDRVWIPIEGKCYLLSNYTESMTYETAKRFCHQSTGPRHIAQMVSFLDYKEYTHFTRYMSVHRPGQSFWMGGRITNAATCPDAGRTLTRTGCDTMSTANNIVILNPDGQLSTFHNWASPLDLSESNVNQKVLVSGSDYYMYPVSKVNSFVEITALPVCELVYYAA